MILFHFLSLQILCFMFSWGAGGIWVGSEGYRKLQEALSCGYKGLLRGLLNSSFGMSIGAECTCISWAAAMCVLWVRAEAYNAWGHALSGGAKSVFLQPHDRWKEQQPVLCWCCRRCVLYLQSSS